jgi:hypothetical protein
MGIRHVYGEIAPHTGLEKGKVDARGFPIINIDSHPAD